MTCMNVGIMKIHAKKESYFSKDEMNKIKEFGDF